MRGKDPLSRAVTTQLTEVASGALPEPVVTSAIGPIQDFPTAERVHLGVGEDLIREGEHTDSVYLLLEGSLRVSRHVDTETAVIAVVDEPGSLIGEMVALGGGTRTATVTADKPSQLIAVPLDDFRSLLASRPGLADTLVEVAIRRAEEGELAELLTDHLGIVDEGALVSTCASVGWRRLAQGEILFQEGDESGSVYFVVRGRLMATRNDPLRGETRVGEVGRGDVVGEVGLLRHAPRGATVTALRDSVVAEMSESTFLALIEGQPRMMVELYLNAVARSESPRWHSAPSTVLGLVVSDGVDPETLIKGILEELSRHGETRCLSPALVDEALGSSGVFNTERGRIEDVRVSRLVHETELEADFLLVQLGRETGPWARRVLGMVDQLLVAVPPTVSEREVETLSSLVGSSRPGIRRTVVVVHRSRRRPSGSGELRRRLGGDDVIHVEPSSADLARLARLSVGRGNALVLGGGGGRGFAHIGVYKALVELGFPIDLVGGTSMGAVLGAVVAAGMTYDEIVTWSESSFADTLDYTIPIVSLTKGASIARHARETFGDGEIEDLWLSFFAMSTDLTASRPHVHESGSIVLAIRATSAIPGVMPPVPNGEALLVDGGVLNNIPMDIARRKAPRGLVIASDVAPPQGPGAHGDYGLSVSGWQALRNKVGSGRSPFPGISAVLMRSMITASMRERDAQVTGGLADCYLDLDIRGVSMLDFGTPGEVARRGYEGARPILESWLSSIEAR